MNKFKKIKGQAPLVVTVFSPITTAMKLSQKRIFNHIKEKDKQFIHKALDVIADTTAKFIEEAIRLGASGVFFATPLSSFDYLTEDEYKEFGIPYDVKALKAANKGWFNIIHIHGNNIMFDLVKDYPVQVINWHVGKTEPTIIDARAKTDNMLNFVKEQVLSLGRISLADS